MLICIDHGVCAILVPERPVWPLAVTGESHGFPTGMVTYQPQTYSEMSQMTFKMLKNVCVLAGLLSLEDIFPLCFLPFRGLHEEWMFHIFH